MKTTGEVGPGSFGGNGVFVILASTGQDGVTISTSLEYNYRFTLSQGDTKVDISLVYRPSDEEMRSAVEAAYSAHVKSIEHAQKR